MAKDDKELIAKIHSNYKSSTGVLNTSNGIGFNGWLKEAEEWYKIISGEQWQAEDYFALQELNRPAVTFNRAGVMIDVVAGLELQNKLEPSFFPRDYATEGATDTKKAEYMNGILKWVRDAADIDQEESQAFWDLLVSGMGWTITTLNYTEDPEGRIEKVHIDPLRCRWDTNCNRKNLKGSRWRMYIMDMPKNEVEDRWNVKLKGTGAPWDSDIEESHISGRILADQEWRYERTSKQTVEVSDMDDGIVHVAVYQYARLEPGNRVVLDDRSFNLTRKEYNERKEDLDALGAEVSKQQVMRVRQAHIVGDEVLDDKPTLTEAFTLNCMTGKYDKANRCFYGLARPMKDPQLWANKFISSILDIVASNAKGGIMAETGAFINERRAVEEWSRNDKVTFLNQGGLGKIGAKPISPLPPGIQYLLEYTSTMFPHTSGISLEMMGLVGKDQPGVLEHQRKQAGMSILAWAFDALRLYRKEDARNMMEIVRQYMGEGRMMRIDGESGPEVVEILRDEMSLEYDVTVDESPQSVNSKERTWAMLTEIVPVMLKSGVPVPPTILKYSPLPEQLKIEWMQYLKDAEEGKDEEEQVGPTDRAKMMKDVASAEKDKALAGKAKVESQLAAVKAQTEAKVAGIKQQELQIKGMQARQGLEQAAVDMIDKLAAARLKQAQAQAAGKVEKKVDSKKGK